MNMEELNEQQRQDSEELRSIRSACRSDIEDWPTNEREGFVCTLFRYIAKCRDERDATINELKELKNEMNK